MGFFEANIFKSAFLQGLGSLLSSTKRVQPVVVHGENGVISLMRLTMNTTGGIALEKEYMMWANIQSLKCKMQGVKESVLSISPRSYIPLQYIGHCLECKEGDTPVEKIDDIATTQYNKAYTRVAAANAKSANTKMLQTVLYLSFFMVCVILLIVFIKK